MVQTLPQVLQSSLSALRVSLTPVTPTLGLKTLPLQSNAMTCHILSAHQPHNLGAAGLNHFALFNPMHKCARAEAKSLLCCESSCCAVLGRRGPRPCTASFEGRAAEPHAAEGPELGRPAPGWSSGGQGSTTQGTATYAWHMFMLASAPYLFSTPLCTAGPPPPEEELGHQR